jgi:hypothetical protein
MSLLGRPRTWLRRLFRRAAKPPEVELPWRFEEAVQLFRLQRPKAGPDEWQAFALRLAAQAYDQGLARGADRARGLSPEEEARRHGWSAREGNVRLAKALAGRDPADPLAGVSLEDRKRFAAEIDQAVRMGVELRLETAPPGPRHDRGV